MLSITRNNPAVQSQPRAYRAPEICDRCQCTDAITYVTDACDRLICVDCMDASLALAQGDMFPDFDEPSEAERQAEAAYYHALFAAADFANHIEREAIREAAEHEEESNAIDL